MAKTVYKPKRRKKAVTKAYPFDLEMNPEAKPGEYRRIEVASRRVGLSLHSRRGYVVPTP